MQSTKAISRHQSASAGACSYLLSSALLLLLLSAKSLCGREGTFNCTGAPDGAVTCSGCSRQFAQHSLCEACLAESLDFGPVCRRCQAGKAVGPFRSASCQPVCFYCLGCELRPLETIGGPSGGIGTCKCDVSRLRQAFDNGDIMAADIWDGRYGILLIDLGENRSGVIDSCRVAVGCELTNRHHATVLRSKNCSSKSTPTTPLPPRMPVSSRVLKGMGDEAIITSELAAKRADTNSSSHEGSVYTAEDQSTERAGVAKGFSRAQVAIAGSASSPSSRSLQCGGSIVVLALISLIAAR